MNRVHALTRLNRVVLEAFSRRTLDQVLGGWARGLAPLRLALPGLGRLLALNVAKEVRKDAFTIRCAAGAFAAEVPLAREVRKQLFDATKAIDLEFASRLRGLPIAVVYRYDEIAPLRTERIERLLDAAYRILNGWPPQRGVRAALQACYRRTELEQLLLDMLRLYALETRVLSRSLKLPALLASAQERFAQCLYGAMTDVAVHLASELTGTVYRRER